MKTNWLKFGAAFLILFAFVFTACEKEELATIESFSDDYVVEYRGSGGEELGEVSMNDHRSGILGKHCFKLVGEVTVQFPDGSTETVDGMDELHELLKDWKENHSPGDGRPEILFPYDVETQDGEIITVESKQDIRKLLRECRSDLPPHPPRPKCFKPVFPLTLEFPDGSTLEVNNRQEMRGAIIEWKQNNPDVDGRPMIAFPFDVELRDGTIVTVESPEDIQDLMEDCRLDGPAGPKKCFKPVFPVTLEFPDGSTLEVNDPKELGEAMRDWKENNPDSDERPMIAFPYDVELRDGTVVTVESGDDIQELLEDCRPGNQGNDDDD